MSIKRPATTGGSELSPDDVLSALRAIGEETRLRILLLLMDGELNVTDLTQILGQSQPRISRHLKLLVDCHLIERVREGSWAFYRLNDAQAVTALARRVVEEIDIDHPAVARDFQRLEEVRQQRSEKAAAYFATHASDWNRIRALHVEESTVEEAILDILGEGDFDVAIDLGTGTGRILELLAPRVNTGIGLDLSHDMLSVARATLDREGLRHCRIRHGDILNVPFDRDCADLIVVHQVLHYLDDPARAIQEAAGLLRPGGRIVIVDFAPHTLEFLRDQHAHQRLGFETDQIVRWVHAAGLVFEKNQDLVPASDGDKERLTVSIWLARDPRPAKLSGADLSEAVA